MWSCLPSFLNPSSPSPPTDTTNDRPSRPVNPLASCPFCNIPPSSQPSSFKIVLESDEFVAFWDRTPLAETHLLTVPRKHVGSVRELSGREGAEMVDAMAAFGAVALDIATGSGASHGSDTLGPEAELSTTITSDRTLVDVESSSKARRRFGFHIPPFSSVGHLHMHCLQEPLTFKGKIKYHVSSGDSNNRPPTIKGWGWFVTADQASQLLRAKRRVRIGAQSAFSTVGGWGVREVGGVVGAQYRSSSSGTNRLPAMRNTL